MIAAIYKKILRAIQDIGVVDTVVDSIATDVTTVDGVADNIYTALGGGAGIPKIIKSISFAAGTIVDGQTTGAISISEVTVGKTLLIHCGQSPDAIAAAAGISHCLASITLSSSISIGMYRINDTGDVIVRVCIVQFY